MPMRRGQHLHRPFMKRKTHQSSNSTLELKVIQSDYDQMLDTLNVRPIKHQRFRFKENESTMVPMKAKKKRVWSDNKVQPITIVDNEDTPTFT